MPYNVGEACFRESAKEDIINPKRIVRMRIMRIATPKGLTPELCFSGHGKKVKEEWR